MNLQTIHEHTIDVDLLTGGVCIDAGCRGFQFSEALRDLGCKVKAFDIEDIQAPDGIDFFVYAIVPKSGTYFYTDTKDQQAKFINSYGLKQVQGCGLNDFYDELFSLGEKEVDVLKLDIEGSEYPILASPDFRPIPKQISVEFHMHCHRQLHEQYYKACMDNLLKHYEPVQHFMSQAHGAGFNFWDSLFIRKDLL